MRRQMVTTMYNNLTHWSSPDFTNFPKKPNSKVSDIDEIIKLANIGSLYTRA